MSLAIRMTTLDMTIYKKRQDMLAEEALRIAKVIIMDSSEEYSTDEIRLSANGSMRIRCGSRERVDALCQAAHDILFSNGFIWEFKIKKLPRDCWDLSGECLRMTEWQHKEIIEHHYACIPNN